MTSKEREQVVELLRRGADVADTTRDGGIAEAVRQIYGEEVADRGQVCPDAPNQLWRLAVQAREAIQLASPWQHTYAEECRIAAQRVEEGRWP